MPVPFPEFHTRFWISLRASESPAQCLLTAQVPPKHLFNCVPRRRRPLQSPCRAGTPPPSHANLGSMPPEHAPPVAFLSSASLHADRNAKRERAGLLVHPPHPSQGFPSCLSPSKNMYKHFGYINTQQPACKSRSPLSSEEISI